MSFGEEMDMKEIWYVVGVEESDRFPYFFETKEVAELAAQAYFPHENREEQYARIFYREVLTLNDIKRGP